MVNLNLLTDESTWRISGVISIVKTHCRNGIQMYNEINYIRHRYLFYLYKRLHVSTHQSVIFRPT